MIPRYLMITMSVFLSVGCAVNATAASQAVPTKTIERYADGRPAAPYRMEAKDQGVVFRHGQGPNQCDYLGARDIWVWRYADTYYMHYDGAGPKGWLACLATSKDLEHWDAQGPVLDFGEADRNDSASASYGTTFFDGQRWHMFYLGTPHTTPAPDYIPAFPYLTMKAEGATPTGPWTKRYDVTPFRVKPNSYYAGCASPGHIVRQGDEYLMLFSASTDTPILRTLSLARTRDLNGPWTLAAEPLLPPTEQVENSSLYFEKTSKTWFMFTNHVGIKDGLEYTDAIWVYWSQDVTHWNPAHKAVVLDWHNCTWSKHIIGLPSVVPLDQRLAIFYDGQSAAQIPPGVKSHMNRDIGLAWLNLPLQAPSD
ncbi:MAG: hypothetical protein GX455_06275 [Phycisphaerae bacterium]|nr:hypothetical protein [Phycisphaerae bacterium]